MRCSPCTHGILGGHSSGFGSDIGETMAVRVIGNKQRTRAPSLFNTGYTTYRVIANQFGERLLACSCGMLWKQVLIIF